MSDEPDSLILRILRDMRAEMASIRAEMATKSGIADMATKRDIADVRSEMISLRADVASDLAMLRRDMGHQIAGLRQAVTQYHSSVIGHGFLISDLEARVRRVEQHLELPPMDQH